MQNFADPLKWHSLIKMISKVDLKNVNMTEILRPNSIKRKKDLESLKNALKTHFRILCCRFLFIKVTSHFQQKETTPQRSTERF